MVGDGMQCPPSPLLFDPSVALDQSLRDVAEAPVDILALEEPSPPGGADRGGSAHGFPEPPAQVRMEQRIWGGGSRPSTAPAAGKILSPKLCPSLGGATTVPACLRVAAVSPRLLGGGPSPPPGWHRGCDGVGTSQLQAGDGIWGFFLPVWGFWGQQLPLCKGLGFLFPSPCSQRGGFVPWMLTVGGF